MNEIVADKLVHAQKAIRAKFILMDKLGSMQQVIQHLVDISLGVAEVRNVLHNSAHMLRTSK